MSKNKKNKPGTGTPQKRFSISPEIVPAVSYDRPARALTYAEVQKRFGPCDSLGWGEHENIKAAQDSALCGAYSLLQHTLNSGLLETVPQFVGYGLLSNLTQNGLIRAGVEMRADEMTRRWIDLKFSGKDDDSFQDSTEQISEMYALLDRYKIRELFRNAAAMCGYFGGCLAYIDMGDLTSDELELPLVVDADLFRKGALKGFRLIEPYYVSPAEYNASNPLSKDYFKPSAWYVQGQRVHASRFLYFSEDKPPTMLLPSYNFFGIPLAQTVLDVVTHFTKCREATAKLLTKFSLTVMKTNMQDLVNGMSDGDIRRRIQYFINNRDNDGLMVVDNETEDIISLNTPLSGTTDIVRQSMEMVAAYFGEPVVKLWGISPAGFNATGDADMKNHNDHIGSLQERILRKPLELVLDILQLNEYNSINKNLTFDFNPLGDENELTNAQTEFQKVQTMGQLFDRGIIDGEEARRALAEDAKGQFTNIDPEKEIMPPDDAGGEMMSEEMPGDDFLTDTVEDGGPGSGRRPGNGTTKKSGSKGRAKTNEVRLPPEEYAVVMRAINFAYDKNYKRKKNDGSICVGDFCYQFSHNGFGKYTIKNKVSVLGNEDFNKELGE